MHIFDQHFIISKHTFNVFNSFYPREHAVKSILLLATLYIGGRDKIAIQMPVT